MSTKQPQKFSKMPEESSGCDRSPHILLIEDDEEMRDMLADTLRREGFDVTECSDARSWLLFCVHNSAGDNDEKYDVVVSDIRMPKIGGLDAMRIINDLNCAEACPPTIFLTAFGDEETHRMAKKLGAVEVLDKPFDIKDLIKKVRKLVSP